MRLMLFLLLAMPVQAVPAQAETWTETKCRLFADAWGFAAPDSGPDAPSPGFAAGVTAFIASACTAPQDICPATDSDRALADLLSLMAVAEGMAGSFLPFDCRVSTAP